MEDTDSMTFHPLVQWTQRKEFIMLRILLQSCEKPDFMLTEDRMDFKVIGEGLNGRREYGFKLSFYESLITENVRVTFSDKELQFKIRKKEAVQWPKLQLQQEKPHWLKTDFDHMELEESSGDEEKDNKLDSIMKKKIAEQSIKELYEKMEKEYKSSKAALKRFTTGYLLVYNGIQWSGFVLILVNIILLALRGKGSLENVYEKTGVMMKFCVAIASLEIVHVHMKLVKSNLPATVAQVLGRMVVLFAVLEPNEALHRDIVVAVLFTCWSAIEVFRYPFYILALLNKEVYILTWLRYSAWIPLYPIGFGAEGNIIYRSLPFIARSGILSLHMPNVLNVAFDFPFFLKMYFLLLMTGSSYLLIHMWRQRKRKLSSTITKKQEMEAKND